MSGDDVQKVLAVAADVNEMAPVALLLAALTCTDLDGAVLTIDSAITVVTEKDGDDHQHTTRVVRDDPTKTGDRRRIALDDDTLALLEPLRSKREQYAPWMFSDDDEPPKPDRIGYWWRRCRSSPASTSRGGSTTCATGQLRNR